MKAKKKELKIEKVNEKTAKKRLIELDPEENENPFAAGDENTVIFHCPYCGIVSSVEIGKDLSQYYCSTIGKRVSVSARKDSLYFYILGDPKELHKCHL